MRIQYLTRGDVSWRIARTHYGDGSIFSDNQIAREGIATLRSHREDVRVPDQKLS